MFTETGRTEVYSGGATEVTLPVGWETGLSVLYAQSLPHEASHSQPEPEQPTHPGEFVAPEGAEPCSSELFVAYSSWLRDVVAFEKSRKDANERKAAASPRQRTMVGAFVCERSPHPLSPLPTTKSR
jgi:hypothetical protein